MCWHARCGEVKKRMIFDVWKSMVTGARDSFSVTTIFISRKGKTTRSTVQD
jgi:hypothetical protein